MLFVLVGSFLKRYKTSLIPSFTILLTKIICTLFCEQGITIISILTALSMTISTIVLAVRGVFGASPPKDEGTLKKWLNRLADTLKRLGAISISLGKAVGFVARSH